MWKLILLTMAMSPFAAYTVVNCDCEIVAFPPLTGSHKMPPTVIKIYSLERLDSVGKTAQRFCRRSCLREFRGDMDVEKLNALLLTFSQELIYDGKLGYNCTGLTTLKYPVKVRARMGEMSLGYVEDLVQVVNHEQKCF